MIVIPPYFALIVRTFSVIEGIALTADPDYAIIPHCLPYLSRRLLTDNDPRMRGALNALIYADKSHIDVERLHKLASSFGQFSTGPARVRRSGSPSATGVTFSAAATERVKGRPAQSYPFAPEDPVISEAVKDAIRVVFSKEGTYAQELIVDELVSAVDAMSREALGEAVKMALSSATTVAALQSVEALGPLRSMLMPLPMQSLNALAPTVKLTEDDKQALHTIRYIMDALLPSLANLPEAAVAGRNAIQAAGELAPMIPSLLPGIQSTMELFVRRLMRRLALRLAEDLKPESNTS
jgi:aarF domain-containing kinase